MKAFYCLIFTLLLCASGARSQSQARYTVGSSGSSQMVIFKQKIYFITQSIGQASSIGTFSNNGFTIRQGYQQPPSNFEIGSVFGKGNLKAAIFPNPFRQALHISFNEIIKNQIDVVLYDVSGRVVLRDSHKAAQLITLHLAHIGTGGYVLHMSTGSKRLSTSLIKQ